MAKKKLTLEDMLVPVDEIPYEVPENWCWVKLKFISSIISKGTTPKGGKSAYIDSGVKFLRVENINDYGYIDLDNIKYISEDTHLGFLKRSILFENDILISIAGTLGKTAIVRKDDLPLNTNQAIAFIRLKDTEKILPKYVKLFLSSPQVIKELLSQTKVTAIPNLTLEIVGDCKIPIPPLAEQERIVNRIESLFDKVDRAAELVDEARDGFEKRRAAILEMAFSGELTKKWREENLSIECSSDLIERIQEERQIRYKEEVKKAKEEGRRPKYNKPSYLDETDLELSKDLKKLPDTWKYTYIGNISELVRGGSPRPSGDPKYFGGNIPWITVAELTKDEDVYLNNTKQTLTELGRTKSRFIEQGTLLLTNSGATLGVPKVSNISGCINDGILSFADIPFVDKFYMYYYLKSQTKRFRNLDQGAAQPNLNTTIVNNWVIPLAPLEEQKEIVKVLEKCLKDEIEVDTISNINENIDVIKKSILAKAFRGELGSNDLNEESSIELLKELIK